MIRSKTTAFILYIFVFFALSMLFNFLVVTFLTHGTYTFSLFGDAAVPIVAALVTGYELVYRQTGTEKEE